MSDGGPIEKPKRLGRPRRDPTGYGEGEPREDILSAAADLFGNQGYRQTSTSQIAQIVGLRQASLFYYFPKKEDILSELLDRSVQRSLEFVERLAEVAPPADIGLYLLIRGDLKTLGGPPRNLGRLQFQPDVRGDNFKDFWTKHARLVQAYQDLVEAGVREGLFEPASPALTARFLCGLVEGASTLEGFPDERPEELWDFVTRQAIRSILADPGRIDDVAERARAMQESI